MNGDQVRTWNVGENIQNSSDCQQIQLKFPWKENKIEKVLSQDEQPLWQIMKRDGADNNR